jgi:hypothetical protein
MIGPTNIEDLKKMIADPVFENCQICSVCAVMCGTKFPPTMRKVDFEEGDCPGCGRKVPLAKIKDWKFK